MCLAAKEHGETVKLFQSFNACTEANERRRGCFERLNPRPKSTGERERSRATRADDGLWEGNSLVLEGHRRTKRIYRRHGCTNHQSEIKNGPQDFHVRGGFSWQTRPLTDPDVTCLPPRTLCRHPPSRTGTGRPP